MAVKAFLTFGEYSKAASLKKDPNPKNIRKIHFFIRQSKTVKIKREIFPNGSDHTLVQTISCLNKKALQLFNYRAHYIFLTVMPELYFLPQCLSQREYGRNARKQFLSYAGVSPIVVAEEFY